MGEMSWRPAHDGVDIGQLRKAMKRDLELVSEEALKLADMAHAAHVQATVGLTLMARGETVTPVFPSADLDMQASRLARRCDHYQALVEVAYLAEQGDL